MRFWRHTNNRIDPVNNDDSDSDESSSSNESAFAVTESEISYSIESFNAVATPVAITMIVSALVVVFINTDETREMGEDLYASTYQILNVSDDQSASQNIGNSLANTLVIVSVICVLTFVVVLCYKFKCMKFFYAYMVLLVAHQVHWRVDAFGMVGHGSLLRENTALRQPVACNQPRRARVLATRVADTAAPDSLPYSPVTRQHTVSMMSAVLQPCVIAAA